MTDSLRISPASNNDDEIKSRALVFRAFRQRLIASNIANADTPGYKAQDANFAEALQGQTTPPSLRTTAHGHITRTLGSGWSTLELAKYSQPLQPQLDGNTVDSNRENAAFAKNSILYQLALMTFDDELKEFKQAAADPRK